MKRFETTTTSPTGTFTIDASAPVNSIQGHATYGQTSAPTGETARPRILARRMARLDRRANR